MTLEREWIEYRNACYPQGCTKLQESECRQAFFAGALAVMQLHQRVAELPESQAVAAYANLLSEAKGVCQERSFELKSRN